MEEQLKNITNVRECPVEIPLKYQTDGRWEDKGIKLNNVFFGWDTKTFYDDVLRNNCKRSLYVLGRTTG